MRSSIFRALLPLSLVENKKAPFGALDDFAIRNYKYLSKHLQVNGFSIDFP